MINGKRDYLLTVLSEEGVELSHAVHKALRFGLDDLWEGRETNRKEILKEYNDLLAVMEMLAEEFPNPRNEAMIQAKKEKVAWTMEYSIKAGQLELKP